MEYNWQRRWIPKDVGSVEHAGSTAKARSFNALWQLRYSSEGSLLEDIRDVPCLILLGEPGMGKTYAVRREHRQLEETTVHGEEYALYVDLLDCDSQQELRKRLFDDQKYKLWKTTAHPLTIFVDSLDQTRMPVDSVIAVLGAELGNVSLTYLKLRLVCRDYDWSATLVDSLRHYWRDKPNKETAVHVYELAPLSEDHIRIAATQSGKDADAFLADVGEVAAVPLATIPITLKMLLNSPTVIGDREILFRKAVLELCRLSDQGEDDLQKDLTRQFQLASRIAAATILSNSYSVAIDDTYAVSPASLTIADLMLKDESAKEKNLLLNTLNSGLFHGTSCKQFSHQSFAEFLTACFLHDNSIPLEPILSKFMTPQAKFAPQLYETIRWLAYLRSDFMVAVIEHEPELALKMDCSRLNDKDFSKLIRHLLTSCDEYLFAELSEELGEFGENRTKSREYLLAHLKDTEQSLHRRRFVFRLLEKLDVSKLEDKLVNLALNKNEDTVLRNWSARCIRDYGSEKTKSQLKQYISGRDDDPEDELKGYALQALWPDHLPADELFSSLSPPKQESYLGSYKMFLFDDRIVKNLKTADLPTALRWVTERPRHHDMPFALRDLPGTIMRKAWDNIHIPDVMEAFTRTAIEMNARFDGIFGGNAYDTRFSEEEAKYYKRFAREVTARRQVLIAALPIWREKDTSITDLVWGGQPIMLTSDLEWLIELLDVSNETKERCQLADLIARLLSLISGSYTSTAEENYKFTVKVYCASQCHKELSDLTQRFFVAILDDPETMRSKESYYRWQKFRQPVEPAAIGPEPIEVINNALEQSESGEVQQWLNIIAGLDRFRQPQGRSGSLWPDLTDHPEWLSFDTDTRQRILQAANTYVRNYEVNSANGEESWYKSLKVPRYEFAGYFALFLLLKAGGKLFDSLPMESWCRWAKIAVWYPYVHIFENDGRKEYHIQTHSLQQIILRKSYQNAPRALVDNLKALIIADDSRDSYVGQTLTKVEHLWNSDLEDTVLGLLCESNLSPKSQRSILDFLLKKESAEAIRVAEKRISRGYTNETGKELVIEFSAGLMTSESEFNWSAAWALFQNNNAIGRAIVEKVAEEDWHTARFANNLSTSQLVDLFIWVEERYPTSEDPQIDGIHTVTTREQVGRLRNGIIHELRKKDSREALDGIRGILTQFPNLEWLHSIRLDLEKAVNALEWDPASPRKILDLLPPITVSRYGPLRQWVRDNPVETTVLVGIATIVVAVILHLLSIRSVNNTLSPSSQDSPSISLTRTVVDDSDLQENPPSGQLESLDPSPDDSISEMPTAETETRSSITATTLDPASTESTEQSQQYPESPTLPLSAES